MNRSKMMKAGLAIGLIGGIISMILVGYAWDGSFQSITNVGFSLLVMALFFATAGGFADGTNMSGKSVAIIAAICVAAVVVAMLYNSQFFLVHLLLIALGVAEIFLASSSRVIFYTDTNRPA